MAEKDGKETGVFNVPLKKIAVMANVAGMFAEVTWAQRYQNEGQKPVEAIYVFPMPEESSVVGCRMIIGDRKVEAELKEAVQARQEYEEAVAAGHLGSLLEQKRSNIFRMSVGGIGAGEIVEVVTRYIQRVPWQDNGGRFNIPLVVAPRFIPGQPSGVKTGGGWAEDTTEVPDASQITPVALKDGVPYTADITINLSAGFPCKITSPSHGPIVGEHRSGGARAITIKAQDLTPDRDFILCYQTESVRVEAGAHRGNFNNEQFAVVEVIPPTQAVAKPKDIICCLDKSGSMHGPKIEGLKLVVEKILRRLQQNPQNRVGIVVFNQNIEPIHPLSEITEATFAAIRDISASGNTYAGRALDYCFQQFPADEKGREKYILLVSDGQTEDRWSRVVPDIRVIAAGIDVAVNMTYLRDIARETNGTSISIYPGEDYDVVAGTLAGLLSGPVLRSVRALSSGQALENVLGVSDVYQSMPGIIYLRASQLPDEIQVTGIDSNSQSVSLPIGLKNAPECSFCHQLWAREKLRDHALDAAEQVKMSLQYGVLCSKTSFVAVLLKEIPGQKPERVEVPVALPHTWDYDAVFGTPVALMRGIRFTSSIRALDVDDISLVRGRVTLGGTLGGRSRKDTLGQLPPISPVPASLVSHASDKLEELLTQLEKGAANIVDARKQWQSISVDITAENVKKWTAVQKAKTYYLLAKLQTYGFTVSKVMKVVEVRPDPTDLLAYDWWLKARRYLGVAVK